MGGSTRKAPSQDNTKRDSLSECVRGHEVGRGWERGKWEVIRCGRKTIKGPRERKKEVLRPAVV